MEHHGIMLRTCSPDHQLGHCQRKLVNFFHYTLHESHHAFRLTLVVFLCITTNCQLFLFFVALPVVTVDCVSIFLTTCLKRGSKPRPPCPDPLATVILLTVWSVRFAAPTPAMPKVAQFFQCILHSPLHSKVDTAPRAEDRRVQTVWWFCSEGICSSQPGVALRRDNSDSACSRVLLKCSWRMC